MLRNVEHSTKPELYIYERANGMAHITMADNIHEGVNSNGEDCWYCDLYMMTLTDSDNMAQRLEHSYELFLEKAKADEAATEEAKYVPSAWDKYESQLLYTALMTDTLLEE